MRSSRLRWLGFLGLLGFLGFVTNNYGFFGFFGFFSFFAAVKKTDERLNMNAYKAGFNSFIVSITGLSILITAFSMNVGMVFYTILIALTFIASILTYVISFVILEKRGTN